MLDGWNSFKYQNIEKWWLWSKWWLSCGAPSPLRGEGREGTDTDIRTLIITVSNT
jgi:hypothetical protein